MSVLQSLDPDMKILVVDDFSTMRRIIKGWLKELGFSNVIEADDGEKALEKLKLSKEEVKLIVSDWSMPRMMGIDFLRAVRADEKYRDVPFLMVTTEGQKENIIEAAEAGVSSYVIKPFTSDVLKEKLEGIFGGGIHR